MEYMALGDLQGYLGKAIPETEARTITVQLLEGLRLMHDEGFAHRDLKPPVSMCGAGHGLVAAEYLLCCYRISLSRPKAPVGRSRLEILE